MKILIGNNHLDTMGGSETYTYTLASTLIKLGHTVEIMLGAPHRLGVMSNKIESDLGVVVEKLTGGYDKVILNHNTTVQRFFKLDLNYIGNVFQICHGTVPTEEQPFLENKIKYISISEEVSSHLKNHYGKNSIVLRNLIDLELYQLTDINNQPMKMYSLTQSDTMNQLLEAVCHDMNIEFTYNNKLSNSISSVVEKIRPADIVVSLGRGCYEAMAMGKNVLIADMRPYMPGYMDGMVTTANFLDLIKNNCSGRFNKIKVNPLLIKEEIGKYHSTQGRENRELINNHFNSTTIVNKMLSIE